MMPRFYSFILGSLVIGHMFLPMSVQASSSPSLSSKLEKKSHFSPSLFFPVITVPTPKVTPTSPTSFFLPIITTFRPVVTPTSVVTPPAPVVTATPVPTVSSSVRPLVLPLVIPPHATLTVPSSTPVVSPSTHPKELELPQDKKDTIKQFYSSMQHKLTDLIEKLDNLASRMDAKVTDLKNRSIDTSAIEKSLNTAKAKISEAKASLADADKKANALLDSLDRKRAFEGLKSAVLGVQSGLKTAHELLTDAANQIKTAYRGILATNSN